MKRKSILEDVVILVGYIIFAVFLDFTLEYSSFKECILNLMIVALLLRSINILLKQQYGMYHDEKNID